MSAFKGTPGPWRAVKKTVAIGWAEREVAWSDAGELVCDVVYEEADARLIAAAPDLLEALKQAVTSMQDSGYQNSHVAVRAARAAIAKATGGAA